MASPYMYYALCFVHAEHSLFHEPISVLINIFVLLAQCLLSTLLVLTLTMYEFQHWPSIAGMLLQSHCRDEEDGLHDVTKYIYIYIYIWVQIVYLL